MNKPAEITLLDYEDRSKEYKAPENKYFKVPLAYWEYGWSRKLDLRSKFCYLINLYRTEFSDIKPWWSLPLDLLAEDFNVEKSTVSRGMRELKKLGLLRGFAIMVEEGNNTEKVESFIQIIGRYSEEWVGTYGLKFFL